MKKLKQKLKKWLNSKKKKLKSFFSAQMFYIRNATKTTLQILKSVFMVVVLMLATVFTMLTADRAHKEYLEHSVGEEILFIKSTPDSGVKGFATGFHVKARSGNVVFITNAHVCQMANKNGILLIQDKHYSNRLIPKRVLEIYENNDLCVVEPLAGYKGLTVANSLSVGEPVWAIGYPLGESMNISNGRVKDFGITRLRVNIAIEKCVGPNLKVESVLMWLGMEKICVADYESIQTDVSIYGGNSGSPLLNIWGNVVGVVFAANSRTNWGRAVPLKDVKQLLKAY